MFRPKPTRKVASTKQSPIIFDFALDHSLAVALGEGYVHTCREAATGDFAHSNTAQIGRVFERGNEHLRSTLYLFGLGNLVDDGIQ